MRQLTEQESIDVLNAILVGYEHLECLDRVQDTTLYKHSLKMKINGLQKELEKSLDALGEVFGIDDTALFDLMENKKQLMKKIATLRPENKSGLNQVLDMYFENPDLLIHRLGIKVVDRDKI